jgi:D-alanine-D-alanine ligase
MKIGFSCDRKSEHIRRGKSVDERVLDGAASGGGSDRPCVILRSEPPRGATTDALDLDEQVETIARGAHANGLATTVLELSSDLARTREELQRLDPQFVFCLVESFNGSDVLSYIGPALLEELRVPFSGGGSRSFLVTSDKVLAKRMLRARGVRTPDWVAESEESLTAEVAGREYIVKPRCLDASLHIGQDSVVAVSDLVQLRQSLADRRREQGIEFFAEAFVEGREFNVSLLGGKKGCDAFGPAELVFVGYEARGLRHIYGYEAKWRSDSFDYRNVSLRFAGAHGGPLSAELEAMARDCWSLFDLRGWARVDFRVDAGGAPHVIEVNCNPCITRDSSFMVALRHQGFDEAFLVRRLMEDGQTRGNVARDVTSRPTVTGRATI